MFEIRDLSVLACVAVLPFAGTFAAAQTLTKVLPVDDPPTHCTDCTTPSGVVLDQPPNASNGIFSDEGCDICGGLPQVCAENFGSNPIPIIGFRIWGGCYPGNVCAPHNFNILIHTDNGGVPGDVLCSQELAGSCDQTGVVLFGVNEWECNLNILDCIVGGGVKWLQVYDNSDFGTDDWFWELGDLDPAHGVPGLVWAGEAPGVDWQIDGANDFAVLIEAGVDGEPDGGDVPATTGAGVMLMVLALLVTSTLFLRRRAMSS